MIRELDSVVLTADLPEHGLERGDLGTVVLAHAGGEGYEVEFVTLGGETVAVVSLRASQVRPIAEGEIGNARRMASMAAWHQHWFMPLKRTCLNSFRSSSIGHNPKCTVKQRCFGPSPTFASRFSTAFSARNLHLTR